jgi:hypothetical protein
MQTDVMGHGNSSDINDAFVKLVRLPPGALNP